jgi:ribulose kinase
VTSTGQLVASHSQDTRTWRDPEDARIFEQSTQDILEAITQCVQKALETSGVKKEDIKGIGIDATCSLAVVTKDGEPVSVSKTGSKTNGDGSASCGEKGERNIVLWADHRAEKEAELINSSGSLVLDYVGGSMSVSISNL